MDPASSALLLNIIQLTVLIVGLTSALALIKNGSKLTGQLMNKTDQLSKQFGLEKGLNATRGGIKNYGKNKALNAEARMASSDSRLGRGVGGFRTRRSMKQKNRERIRGQALEEGYYRDLTTGTDRQQAEKRAKAVGIGGAVAAQEADRLGRQAGGYANAKERQRVAEELKHEALRLEAEIVPGPNAATELAHELENAINSGNQIQIEAVMGRLANEGKGGVQKMGDVLQRAAESQDLNSDVQDAINRGRAANYGTIKGSDPALATMSLDQADHAAGTAFAGTSYTAEQFAGMSGDNITAAISGTRQIKDADGNLTGSTATAPPVDLSTLRQTINNPEIMRSMDSAQRTALNAALVTHHGTSIDQIQKEHAEAQAKPIVDALSDRRLKKNISKVGMFDDIPLYRFQYKEGGATEYVGTMAQDIKESYPNAVSVDVNGYYRVNYSRLGFSMTTHKEWLSKKR